MAISDKEENVSPEYDRKRFLAGLSDGFPVCRDASVFMVSVILGTAIELVWLCSIFFSQFKAAAVKLCPKKTSYCFCVKTLITKAMKVSFSWLAVISYSVPPAPFSTILLY